MNIKNLLKWGILLVAFLAYKEMDWGSDPRSSERQYLSPMEQRNSN